MAGYSEDRRDAPPKYDGRLAGPDPPTPDCRPMDYRLASVPPTYVRDALDTAHRSGAQGGCSLESLGPSRPQAQPACAGVRWAGIGAVAVRRDELDGTGAELTIPMTVPTSCRAYRADARSAGRDIYGNQDLHVPVLQRARDMQVFLYILPLCACPGAASARRATRSDSAQRLTDAHLECSPG